MGVGKSVCDSGTNFLRAHDSTKESIRNSVSYMYSVQMSASTKECGTSGFGTSGFGTSSLTYISLPLYLLIITNTGGFSIHLPPPE